MSLSTLFNRAHNTLHHYSILFTEFFFCSLLRLYGSYEALKGGKTSEAIVDFTGGLVESHDLKKKEEIEGMKDKMIKSSKKASFMSCSIR